MTPAIPVIAAAAFALAACDLSQKKPETIATMLPTAQTAGTATQAASAARSAAPAHTADEHSVRLYGPGVSRERQTRI